MASIDYSFLFSLCRDGEVDLANHLINTRKLDVNYVNTKKETALLIACYYGKTKIVELLLKHGADPNLTQDMSPLGMAISFGNAETLRLLLENGVDYNVTWDGGITPLHRAVFSNSKKAVKYLIRHGANPNVTTTVGWDPLAMACNLGKFGVAKLLLKHYDVKLCNEECLTTILYYTIENDNADFLLLLIKKGFDINGTRQKELCTISLAVKLKKKKCALVLLNNGVDLFTREESIFHHLGCMGNEMKEFFFDAVVFRGSKRRDRS